MREHRDAKNRCMPVFGETAGSHLDIVAPNTASSHLKHPQSKVVAEKSCIPPEASLLQFAIILTVFIKEFSQKPTLGSKQLLRFMVS